MGKLTKPEWVAKGEGRLCSSCRNIITFKEKKAGEKKYQVPLCSNCLVAFQRNEKMIQSKFGAQLPELSRLLANMQYKLDNREEFWKGKRR